MRTFNAFHLSYFLCFVLLFSSCSMLNPVTDDDVYVLNTPTLEDGEALDDEASYQHYKYNKERERNNIQYGFHSRRSMLFYTGSPYVYHGMVPYYGFAYSPYDHGFYNPYYTNYWFYPNYTYNAFYDPYFNGGAYNSYYNGFYGNPYYNNSTYNYSSTGATTTNYNTHYRARNATSGVNISRRGVNSSTWSGNMAGMKTASKKNRSTYAHTTTARVVSKENSTSGVRSSRPVERGVGLSRSGTRVTSNTYERSASPAYQRSSNEYKNHVGRSGASNPKNITNSPSKSNSGPTKSSSTPTIGRRKN